MRSPAWIVAYAVVLVLLGATYATLAFSGPKAALVLALGALAAVFVSLALALRR